MDLKNEIDLIIDYLQKGSPLPAEYKDILFPPMSKGCELAYQGKMPKEDILAQTDEISHVPLQIERTFAANAKNGAENWQNLLIFGDNLQVLKALYYDLDPLIKEKVRGKVKLIYIDPPFATEKEFNAVVGQKAYADRVSGAAFIEFLRQRLTVMRELLAPDGFICVHLDYREKHYIKVIMDEIFGGNNFRNEIAVSRVKKSIREKKTVRKLNEEFDTLLLYAKSEAAQLLPPTRTEKKEARWHAFDAPEVRNGMDYDLFGRKPNSNRHWTWEEPRARAAVENYKRYEQEHKNGESIDAYCLRMGKQLDFLRPKATTGTPEYYISASDTVLCNNLWNDIPAYSFSNSYPTEKSEALLARIIGMTTVPGDLVMDCFAGSGTTLAVAEKMQRRWIGCDIGKLSLYTMQKRLLQIGKSKDLFAPSRKFKKEAAPFCVVTAGLTDSEKGFTLSSEKYIAFVKTLFGIEDTATQSINGITVDGKKNGYCVNIYPYWDAQMRNADIGKGYAEFLHAHISSYIEKRFYIVAPADSVALLDDYCEIGGIRYYFLKIPYQVIRELQNDALKQPQNKKQAKKLTETIEFHFKHPLEVESTFLHKEDGDYIAVSGFRCEGAAGSGKQENQNFDSLSLILLDEMPDDNSDRFAINQFFFVRDLIGASAQQNCKQLMIPLNPGIKKVRIVYMDIFGNEFSEILSNPDF